MRFFGIRFEDKHGMLAITATNVEQYVGKDSVSQWELGEFIKYLSKFKTKKRIRKKQ